MSAEASQIPNPNQIPPAEGSKLGQPSSPVVINYPPTRRVFAGGELAEHVDDGFRAAGVALPDPDARRHAVDALPTAYRRYDYETQLVITGTRTGTNGLDEEVVTLLRPNLGHKPDHQYTCTVLGEDAKPTACDVKLSDDGRSITIGDVTIAIGALYLLPRIESFSGAARQDQIPALAVTGIAAWIRSIRRRPTLERVTLPHVVIGR